MCRRLCAWLGRERLTSNPYPDLNPDPNLNPSQVHQLSTALDEHKKEVETLRNDNVHQVSE